MDELAFRVRTGEDQGRLPGKTPNKGPDRREGGGETQEEGQWPDLEAETHLQFAE